jgi:SAM-dependent methyltransferase
VSKNALRPAPKPEARRRHGDVLVRDAELRAGTEAHYEDPAYYRKTYESRREDVRFYLGRALASGGPVLEHGCGNGRIALAIARAGVDVVGVDLSKPMLDDFRARLATEPREVVRHVTLRRGDMRKVRFDKRFPLVICPFNAFLHLYDRPSVEAFLARTREHLSPGGELVFDVSIPEPEELARKPERAYRTPRFNYPGVGLVRYAERFEYEPLRQVLFVSMEFVPESGAPAFSTPLAHRQFFPQELEALLHYNGFAITKLEGDFSGPATNTSTTLIVTARRARTPRR